MSNNKRFLVYYGDNERAIIADSYQMRRLYIKARFHKEIITVIEADKELIDLLDNDLIVE